MSATKLNDKTYLVLNNEDVQDALNQHQGCDVQNVPTEQTAKFPGILILVDDYHNDKLIAEMYSADKYATNLTEQVTTINRVIGKARMERA